MYSLMNLHRLNTPCNCAQIQDQNIVNVRESPLVATTSHYSPLRVTTETPVFFFPDILTLKSEGLCLS